MNNISQLQDRTYHLQTLDIIKHFLEFLLVLLVLSNVKVVQTVLFHSLSLVADCFLILPGVNHCFRASPAVKIGLFILRGMTLVDSLYTVR